MSFTIKTSTKVIRYQYDAFEFSLTAKGIRIIKRKMNKLYAIDHEKLPFTNDSVKIKYKWCDGNNIDEIKLRGEYRIKFEFNHYNFKGYRGWYARIIKARLIEPESESEPDYGEGRDEAELKCVEGNNESEPDYGEGRNDTDPVQLGINDCPICTEEIKGGPYTTECAHTFHTVCIKKWINGGDNRKCPVCRQETGIRREVNNVENKINNGIEGKINDDVGYDLEGFDRNHMHYNGTRYNNRGFDYLCRYRDGTFYDPDGFDFRGYDLNGFNRNHMHSSGSRYNFFGFDIDHIYRNRTPYDKNGFNYKHIHKNGTPYGDDGFSYRDIHKITGTDYNEYGFYAYHTHRITQVRFDPRGFDDNHIHKNTTTYDDLGFNHDGKHRNGTYLYNGFDCMHMHMNGTMHDDLGFDYNGRHIDGQQTLHNSTSKRKYTKRAIRNKRYTRTEVNAICPMY